MRRRSCFSCVKVENSRVDSRGNSAAREEAGRLVSLIRRHLRAAKRQASSAAALRAGNKKALPRERFFVSRASDYWTMAFENSGT